MLKMGAYPAHSSFSISSFVQSVHVADDPKKGLPSFSCRSYLHIMRQRPLRGTPARGGLLDCWGEFRMRPRSFQPYRNAAYS
jgi:hypothetical protein